MRMRRIDRLAFENPAIRNEKMFEFNQQRAVDLFFARKFAEAKAAKAKAAVIAK